MGDKIGSDASQFTKRYKDMGDQTFAERIASRILDENDNPIRLGAPICLGVYVLSVDASDFGNDLASLIAAAPGGAADTLEVAIAAGLASITATVETFPVKVNFFGGNPAAAGHLYGKDNLQPYVWDSSDSNQVHIVGVGGTASVTISLWK